MGLVDFTNPDAVKWYVECLNGLFDQGVDCIKTDFGERIPTLDVEWFDKSVDAHKMHVSVPNFASLFVHQGLTSMWIANSSAELLRLHI